MTTALNSDDTYDEYGRPKGPVITGDNRSRPKLIHQRKILANNTALYKGVAYHFPLRQHGDLVTFVDGVPAPEPFSIIPFGGKVPDAQPQNTFASPDRAHNHRRTGRKHGKQKRSGNERTSYISPPHRCSCNPRSTSVPKNNRSVRINASSQDRDHLSIEVVVEWP
jgi:hypothetical protein